MRRGTMSRRDLLRSAAAAGLAGAAGPLARRAAAGARAGAPTMLSLKERTAVDRALGKKGNVVANQGVYTVPLPRNDLPATIKGERVPIPFGFVGWVAFKKTRDGKATVMMSDTVLLEEEVNPVLSAAQANRIEITAIHNHFFYEQPRIFYMHLHAMGEPGDLARRYAAAIRPSRLHPAKQPPEGPPMEHTAQEIFEVYRLDDIVKHRGVVNGLVYKYTVGRPDLRVTALGAEIMPAMGLNSWAALTGTMERAHVAGDIAMLEPEVNPVIAALRKHNLEVVALHHHMLGEEPRILFLHYYGTGPATALARGFRAALNELGRHGRTLRMGAM